ncbi:copper chaperone NosL [Persephonella hydrogeniphila]|uniref:Copper chaperone NosL n=1 Tax=Persephonella hydrogeniphila TaxID=198703 RepID=A0A285NL88_9AQUI|nr:nitrous oxide reductase accessory protein NosL [Persephonella hydrogeniphila]SNZ08636.1 copper chaperone NosL [Persephonella hydrogeniphila]
MKRKTLYLLLLVAPALIFLIFTSCEKKEIQPVTINYGQDECEYCRMKITDPRYGSELLLKTGKAYKFDSIECLAAFYIENKDKLDIHSLWVPDFLTKKFIRAENAIYLHSKDLPSPMGLNLSAFETREELEKVRAKYSGEILNWQQVLELVKKEWIEKHKKMHQHMHM